MVAPKIIWKNLNFWNESYMVNFNMLSPHMWPLLWNILKHTINLKTFGEGLNNKNQMSKFENVLKKIIQNVVFVCKSLEHNEVTTNSWRISISWVNKHNSKKWINNFKNSHFVTNIYNEFVIAWTTCN